MTLQQYDENLFDEDGYPRQKMLDKIREWRAIENPHGLMTLMQALWHWGATQYEQYTEDDDLDRSIERYIFHTGGWSGNESLIRALSDNTMYWLMYWWSSKRGGHYEFRIPNPRE